MDNNGEYLAAAAVQSTANYAQSNFRFKNTKKLMKYQNQMNIDNWNLQNERQDKLNANQYSTLVQSAQNAGVNPASVLGNGNNMQVGAIPAPTPAETTSTPLDLGAIGNFVAQAKLLSAESRIKDAQAESIELANEDTKAKNSTVEGLLSRLGVTPDTLNVKRITYGVLGALSDYERYDIQKDDNKTKKLLNEVEKNFAELQNSDEGRKAISDAFFERMKHDGLTNEQMRVTIKKDLQDISNKKLDALLTQKKIKTEEATYYKISTETDNLGLLYHKGLEEIENLKESRVNMVQDRAKTIAETQAIWVKVQNDTANLKLNQNKDFLTQLEKAEQLKNTGDYNGYMQQMAIALFSLPSTWLGALLK